MRKLLWLLVIGAGLWSGYWVLGAAGLGRGLDHWLELRRNEGWQAEVAGSQTKGFPFVFVTRVEGITLVDPETGLGWTAPHFDVRAEAHAPTYVEVVWPKTQEFLTPHETIGVEAVEIKAGLGLVPGPALALDTSDVSLNSVTLKSSAGWNARLDSGRLATRRLEDPLAHHIDFSAHGLKPARPILELLDPLAMLPPSIATMELDMEATFDAPWDRHAIEDRRPQPTAFEIRTLKAKWGQIEIEATGAVLVDERGVPDGEVSVRAVNWRRMLEVADAGGWVPQEFLPTVRRGLEVLAGLTGNPETIDATLTLSGGFVRMGPIPIGPAPVLRLR